MAKSNTHGKLFSATGGLHLTLYNIFINAEMATRDKEKKRQTTKKSKRLRQVKVEEKAKTVLDTKGRDCKGWNKTDLDAVLAWNNPPKRTQLSTREEKEQAVNDGLMMTNKSYWRPAR